MSKVVYVFLKYPNRGFESLIETKKNSDNIEISVYEKIENGVEEIVSKLNREALANYQKQVCCKDINTYIDDELYLSLSKDKDKYSQNEWARIETYHEEWKEYEKQYNTELSSEIKKIEEFKSKLLENREAKFGNILYKITLQLVKDR